MRRDYYVTVCAECCTASCWHGKFYCERAKSADTKRMRASELRKLKLEHSSNYSKAKLLEVCGAVLDVNEP
jgi:hypothetical protein